MMIFTLLFFLSSRLFAKDCAVESISEIYSPHYSKGFSINYYPHFKIIKTQQHQYLLSDKKPDCSGNYIFVKTPVKKAVMMSTTYLPSLEILNEEETLIGFQGKHYIVSRKFNLAKIENVSYKLNTEALLKLKPDLVMGYGDNLLNENQLRIFEELKIPFVLNADFSEHTPLARAEWIIFISAFYNKESKAKEFFESVAKKYKEIKFRAMLFSYRPSVLVGEIQNGYWITCGGKSDLAQLIDDAGGTLAFKNDATTTQQMSLETLFKNKKTYDVWLTHNNWRNKNDREEAAKKDGRYQLIKAKAVYNNNKILNEHGSNDYWESGMQRPDLMLSDLLMIIYPQLQTEAKLRWYNKL